MRKFLTVAALAASTLLATPAFAQTDKADGPFTGPRIGVVVGSGGDDPLDFDNATIGIDAGYDFDFGGTVVGVGAEYQTDLGDDFLDVNETAVLIRAGGKIGTNGLLYVSGGYTHLSTGASPFEGVSEHGYRIGAGGEFLLGTSGTSLKVEQRYLNYGNGADAFQTVAGISLRF